jgi:hypothetical protein
MVRDPDRDQSGGATRRGLEERKRAQRAPAAVTGIADIAARLLRAVSTLPVLVAGVVEGFKSAKPGGPLPVMHALGFWCYAHRSREWRNGIKHWRIEQEAQHSSMKLRDWRHLSDSMLLISDVDPASRGSTGLGPGYRSLKNMENAIRISGWMRESNTAEYD